jgi:hypothetical protein
MVAIAIMVIFSSVVFQAWEDVLQRENEAEMIFRAQEISRAIARYHLDRRDVPRSLDALMEPGPRGQYYLRMAYRDPLVADGVWGLLFDGPDGQVIDPGGQVGPERLLGFANTEGLQELSRQREQAPGPRENRGAAAIGRIAGVRTLCQEQPFRVYKGFTDYSQWLFTYHDYEQQGQGRTGRPGQRNRPPARDLGGTGLSGRDGGRLGGGLSGGQSGGTRRGGGR